MNSFNERTKLAIELTRKAGEKIAEIQKGDMCVQEKGVNDVLTIADTTSEKMITDNIYSAFPDDGMIAEEGSRKESKTGYTWVADPLDGTVNFSRGLPLYCVSIGYMKDGVPMGGAVYIPKLDEMFVCEKGKGAWLNSERISVSTRDLKSSLVLEDFAVKCNSLNEYLPMYKNIYEKLCVFGVWERLLWRFATWLAGKRICTLF